jgi:ankyrin repeat protein
MDGAALLKIHSAVRWGKPITELKELGLKDRAAADAQDEKNGNTALHIAVQNGHLEIVQLLVDELNCSVDVQNKVGNTALHMGVEYDYYQINKILVAAGADQMVENGENAKAIEGLSGTKVGQEKWDNPVTILKTVDDDVGALEEVFKALESAAPEDIKKEELVRVGMAKKKELKAWKDGEFQPRFMKVVSKI